MELTHAQKKEFHDNGFVRIPGAVPRVMVNRALRAINHSMGQGMNVADMPTLRAQSYTPELQQDPVIKDLVEKTPAWAAAESAIGAGKFRIGRGQIALRFPLHLSADALPAPSPQPHIDGMYTPTNGVPKGSISNFTALICVLLSDLPHGNSGNFTVWPGTHRLYQNYFRERGPQSLLEGMPKVDLPQPVHVTGQAGDIILAHYLLGHGIAPNLSPNIRYACFFRLTHAEHETQKWESMTDMWLQWPGIREAMEKTAG